MGRNKTRNSLQKVSIFRSVYIHSIHSTEYTYSNTMKIFMILHVIFIRKAPICYSTELDKTNIYEGSYQKEKMHKMKQLRIITTTTCYIDNNSLNIVLGMKKLKVKLVNENHWKSCITISTMRIFICTT